MVVFRCRRGSASGWSATSSGTKAVGGDDRGCPEADLGREVAPERPVRTRAVDDERCHAHRGRTEPRDPDRRMSSWIVAQQRPAAECGVRAPETGPRLGDARSDRTMGRERKRPGPAPRHRTLPTASTPRCSGVRDSSRPPGDRGGRERIAPTLTGCPTVDPGVISTSPPSSYLACQTTRRTTKSVTMLARRIASPMPMVTFTVLVPPRRPGARQ